MRPLALLLALLSGCGRDRYRVDLNVERWIHDLGSDDLEVSSPAEDSLVSLGPSVLPALAQALEREPPEVRRGVVEVASRLPGSAGVPLLMKAMTDDRDDEVRSQSLLSLGVIGDARARPVAEAALADPALEIRMAAASACATLCASPEALKRLVEVGLHDDPLGARQSLAKMLEEPGGSRAPAARQAIEEKASPVLAADGSSEERVRAALLLAELGDPATTPVLVEAAGAADKPNLRIYAVYELGKAGDERAVPVLAAHLHGGDAGLATYSYDALRRLAERGVRGASEAMAGYAGPRPERRLPAPGL